MWDFHSVSAITHCSIYIYMHCSVLNSKLKIQVFELTENLKFYELLNRIFQYQQKKIVIIRFLFYEACSNTCTETYCACVYYITMEIGRDHSDNL